MHTVQPDPAFAGLTEAEVNAALERYDALCEAEAAAMDMSDEDAPEESDEDDEDDETPISDPVVREIARLVSAYAERLDSACREHGEIPEQALLYRPATAIEQVAFRIFTEALHDSLQDADEE